MTSAIVPGNIDGTFPVAGQDNSSQGFRDNFTAIVNNFTTASSEITSLQNNTASTNASTNFNGYTISNANFQNNKFTVVNHGSISDGTTVTLNYESGHYHQITGTIGHDSTNGAGGYTLAFSNMPGTGAGRMILDMTFTSNEHVLYLTSTMLVADNVTGFNASTNAITVTTAGRYLYEFISIDNSNAILMHQLGKLYTTTP